MGNSIEDLELEELVKEEMFSGGDRSIRAMMGMMEVEVIGTEDDSYETLYKQYDKISEDLIEKAEDTTDEVQEDYLQ